MCMKDAESLAFLFVNVPIGGPESHMYPSVKCQFMLFS